MDGDDASTVQMLPGEATRDVDDGVESSRQF